MIKLSVIVAVGIGGAFGAILRTILCRHLPTFFLTYFPAPIFLVNIFGCFLIGVLIELMASYWTPNNLLKEFVTTGFLGGFTTFSAFSLEFALIVERGLNIWALIYASVTFIGVITAFFAGLKIVKFILNF